MDDITYTKEILNAFQMNTADEIRLNNALDAITEQYTEKAVSVAGEEGPGISLFRFLPNLRKGKFNCDYFYARQSEYAYKKIMEWSPYGKLIEDTYDPNTMFLICVQIPTEEEDGTTGNIRIFDVDSRKEIEFESKDDELVNKDVSSKSTDI